MITIEEVSDIITRELAASGLTVEEAGLAIALRTVEHPTYDVVDGQTVMRVDADGEVIKHPIQAIDIKHGRVTCSIELVIGNGSPHERLPRDLAEVERLICAQVGNALRESLKKPRSAAEHAVWEARIRAQAAERERAAYEAHLHEQRAAMTPEQLAAHDYLLEHGERPYEEGTLERMRKSLPVAVRLGAISQEDADAEIVRVETWKRNHETRSGRR